MKSVAALIREGHSLADAVKKSSRKKRADEKAAVEAIEEVAPEDGDEAAK
jgi:hypothetical protein